ncbi:MAG: hypothetical protein JSV88_25610 [Candidatus Aminicenantes bacterium]|nr:MAG: hypothetical protein JSV88_25610 [Candidatus Aminicenantes bacterium]
MKKKTIKMRYTGRIPVRIPGISGHIKRNEVIEVPEEIAKNLDRDLFFQIVDSQKKNETPKIQKKQPQQEKEVKNE